MTKREMPWDYWYDWRNSPPSMSNDPAWAGLWLPFGKDIWELTLDGKPVTESCNRVETGTKGYVQWIVTDENGNFVTDNGHIKTERRYGHVRLFLKEAND